MLNELPRNRVDRPSSLHFGRLAAQSSKAAHSPQLLTESAGAKRRISARGGEWGEQTLQQACSQAYPGSAICVQNFDDSLNSAIRITYRISLRSSSLREPRYPLLKVVSHWYVIYNAAEATTTQQARRRLDTTSDRFKI